MVPLQVLDLLSPQQLQRLVCGIPTVNIQLLKAHTKYTGYTVSLHVLQDKIGLGPCLPAYGQQGEAACAAAAAPDAVASDAGDAARFQNLAARCSVNVQP